MSRRRNSSRSSAGGANLLKFSDISLTSARARHVSISTAAAANEANQTDTSVTTTNNNGGGGGGNNLLNCFRRRRFFDDSTGFGHILHQMLFFSCQNITSLALVPKRLLIYAVAIVFGSIVNEFLPGLLRPFRLSSKSLVNKLFIRFGWGISLSILVTFVFLLSHSVHLLQMINFDRIESSFDEYQAKRNQLRLQQLSTTTNKDSRFSAQELFKIKRTLKDVNFNFSGPISLNDISNLGQQNAEAENMRHIERQLYNMTCHEHAHARYTFGWLATWWNADMARLTICNLVYLLTINIFKVVLNYTKEKMGAGRNNYTKLMKSNDSLYQYFDISGHLFVLVFSNLILFEESGIIGHYEHLVEKMTELFKEYVKLGVNEGSELGQLYSVAPSLREDGIALSRAKLNVDWSHAYVKGAYVVATLYSLFLDAMILQTSFFYHTIFEKVVAFGWALACWYTLYRHVFPTFNLGHKRILLLRHCK